MKTKKIIPILVMLPLLASCGGPKELVIPTVDVDSIVPELPTRPVYNTGAIKSDDTYDYLDIYELSDFHGAVNEERHSEGNYIGLPKLADYLNIKRSANQGGTIVVSSGDMFQGSAESNLTRGYMVNYAMNYMGFDSMAIGNHEFDWTDSWLKKNANLAYNEHKIPYISANIVKKGTTETPDFLSKSTTITRGNYKIGIIGSIGENLEKSILKSCIEGYEFTNETEAINAEAKKLKDEGCDVVIVTSHNDVDILKGNSYENVDAIFGGHAHYSNRLTIGGYLPAVQTKNYGASIAHIQLAIDKTTKAVSCSAYGYDDAPTTLAGLKENEDVKKIMNAYTFSINDIKNIKLGKCDNDLIIKGALKNVCVEGMYQGAIQGIKDLGLEIPEDKIVATFHNIEGGIRKDIEKGEITYGDVYGPFPFDNEIVLYKVKGSLLKSNLPQFASYAVRRSFTNKEELDNNTDYYLVLTDFIALSSAYVSKIFPIHEEDLIRTGKVVREEVAQLIFKTGEIKTANFASGKAPYVSIPLI